MCKLSRHFKEFGTENWRNVMWIVGHQHSELYFDYCHESIERGANRFVCRQEEILVSSSSSDEGKQKILGIMKFEDPIHAS